MENKIIRVTLEDCQGRSPVKNRIVTLNKRTAYVLKEATRLLKESAKLRKDADKLLGFVNKSLAKSRGVKK